MLFREVREVGGTESVCFVMVRREFLVSPRTVVRVSLNGILRAVVVRSTKCDVGTSSVCGDGSFPTIFLVNGRFTFAY